MIKTACQTNPPVRVAAISARRLYEEFIATNPKHAHVKMANARLDVLKRLGRFQDLIDDDMVDRNKGDAQFQIGRTVLPELQNPIKAVSDFREVVAKYPKSNVADDAQLEIGKALLGMNRLEEGREELLKVPRLYPGSPLADDALFLIAGSFEQRDKSGRCQNDDVQAPDSSVKSQLPERCFA